MYYAQMMLMMMMMMMMMMITLTNNSQEQLSYVFISYIRYRICYNRWYLIMTPSPIVTHYRLSETGSRQNNMLPATLMTYLKRKISV